MKDNDQSIKFEAFFNTVQNLKSFISPAIQLAELSLDNPQIELLYAIDFYDIGLYAYPKKDQLYYIS